MIFWDTSAFARAFLAEDPGYGLARNLLRSDARHACSTLLWPEAASALLRRAKLKGQQRGFDIVQVRKVLEGFERVDLLPPVAERAFELVRRFNLSGPDAVHLASGLEFARKAGKRGLTFASSDREQASAARASGLRVLSPGL
ncbi:MAG: type II toxin-antitoxin system VapC family toxin [Planctomycetes bacterium]|nr:type II toxin-antitoxin system VapC family toxin [Planctomycetota bacterium]